MDSVKGSEEKSRETLFQPTLKLAEEQWAMAFPSPTQRRLANFGGSSTSPPPSSTRVVEVL